MNMKRLILLLLGCMMLTVGCSREVYINKQSEIIREKDKSSDVRIIDRDKQVYDRERKVIRDNQNPDSSSSKPTDSGYETVID